MITRKSTWLCAVGFSLAVWPAHAGFDGSSCSFDGNELKGQVEIVDSFPDVKVQIVDSFPDLKVQLVSSFADDCGEWEVVSSSGDFKVQYVDSFPDIKVQMVDSFPGVP